MQFHQNGAVRVALLFDWNGTLVDDSARALDAANAVMGATGLPLLANVADFRATFRLPLDRWFERLGVPKAARRAAVRQWNAEMALRPAPLRAGAHELLTALRSMCVPVGVISAASFEAVTTDCRRFGVAPLITRMEADVARKRTAIQAAIRALAVEQAIYIGDTEYDMFEAVAAGVVPHGISGGYRSDEALANAGAQVVWPDLAAIQEFVASRLAPGDSQFRL
jgi:phosphoglycolate phosphatase